MVAIVVSLASTLIAVTSPSYSSSFLTKLRSSPSLRLSFAVTPLCSRRGKLMAHTLARATLGLTFPSGLDAPKISFAAKDIDLTEWKGDLLAVGVTEKDLAKDENSKFQNSILKNLDSRLGGLLAEASSEEDFTGKSGQSTVVRLPGLGLKRIGLFGLGQSASSTAAFRGLGEAAATTAKATQASDLAIVLASSEELSAKSNTASAIASGTLLGIYEDSRYKSESKKSALKSVDILGLGTGPEVEKKLKYAEDVTSGIIFGKELVNSPANVLTPGKLAEEASKIASTYSDVLSAKILNEEQCKELKMGSYLAVAAASANPPHFIHLIYKPPGGPAKVKLGLVGKGLTFDSGGYNIKTGPGCSIELMKFDMGGSGAVLGAAKAIGQIKPPGVEVHFIVAACENMISGTGMRPGDIVTASNGKTIEVNNTDAEGRLTLADALVYACNQGVEKIVDLATLTGACVVALGPSIAGVFTPSDDLAKEVFAASEQRLCQRVLSSTEKKKKTYVLLPPTSTATPPETPKPFSSLFIHSPPNFLVPSVSKKNNYRTHLLFLLLWFWSYFLVSGFFPNSTYIMCGILAVLGCSDDSQAKRVRVLELSRRLKHRGPDWSGLYQHGDCFLAHQRLAIIDPASGDQPLYNEDKSIVVTVNGEIYNHEELRKRLPNHKFRTGSDCDVIAHLYEEYGENFVDMLDGMFSFVLLDTRDNSFIVARDAIGITSLYIGWSLDGSVWIASELKGLNDDCEHFESFPPGHLYSSKEGALKRWYNPTWYSEAIPSAPYDPLAIRSAFETAVIKRLMTDVPFGVLLSGGLDSSLVASITARHLAGTKAAKQWGAQLHSFCVGLVGSPDLKAAKEVADYLGTVHHEFHFTVQDGIDAIEDVIYHIETYDVTTIRASTPMFLMSRKIKSLGVKMVISGEGSDEIFGGYLYFHKAPNKEEFHRETCRKIKALHQYDCLRANKSTSAWGLEARVPFLDKDFINVAMAIDPEFKLIKKDQGRIEKWVLRKAFDDEEHPYLPKHILYRQKEQFSDGVGYSWIDGLKSHAALHVTDKMMLNAARIFPHNTPTTKEAYYYRMIFERFFPQNSARNTVPGGPSVACSTATAVAWDAEWSKNLDPSGRAIFEVHQQAYDKQAAPVTSSIVPPEIIDNVPQMKVSTPGVAILS